MHSRLAIGSIFASGLVPLLLMGCSDDSSDLSQPALIGESDSISVSDNAPQPNAVDYNLALIDQRLNDSNTADDGYWQMVKDMGGTYAFLTFQDEATKEEVADKYMQYGMEYHSAGSDNPANRASAAPDHVSSDCPPYFRSFVANSTWELRDWALGNHTTSIDLSGRPFLGIVEINFGLTPVDIARDDLCAYSVRTMGGRFDSDDAGHLIAKSLGGWNKRANLVPQNRNANRGTINNVIERSVRDCARRNNSLIKYGVTAKYRDPWNLRPTHFDVEIWVSKFTGVGISGLVDAFPRYKHALIRNESAGTADRMQASNFANFVTAWC